jgi:hypothetical protein
MDGGNASFTRQDAEAIMSRTTLSFTLDGAPLSTTRTSVRPSLDPRAPAFREIVWLVRYRAFERCTDGNRRRGQGRNRNPIATAATTVPTATAGMSSAAVARAWRRTQAKK